jgi:glycosyltransferase involved in cell wall biosynthesis
LRPQIFCLTPVKNEAWILDKFLRAVELWADKIIIADDHSTDGSQEIAAKYNKVSIIANPSPKFDEPGRQKLLINEARKYQGNKLLIALDADEFLSSGFSNTDDWKKMLCSQPGTVVYLRRAEVLPGLGKYYGAEYIQPYCFIDNGAEHSGRAIHSHRIPVPSEAISLHVNDFVLLHMQNVNVQRMESKHRWYKCFERVTFPRKRPLAIMRLYDRHYATAFHNVQQIPAAWLSDHERTELNGLSNEVCNWFWWDKEVAEWIAEYGPDYFQKINIWEIRWTQSLSRKITGYGEPRRIDHRSAFDKAIHSWVYLTRRYPSKLFVRVIDRFFGLLGY